MNQFVNDIKGFMNIAEQTTDGWNTRQVALYIGLKFEETAEILQEICPDSEGTISNLKNLSKNFKAGTFDWMIENRTNRVNLMKELLDDIWVGYGALISMGVDVEGGMEELAYSNLSKTVYGKMLKDSNGKVIKPPSYRPADMSKFV